MSAKNVRRGGWYLPRISFAGDGLLFMVIVFLLPIISA